MGFSIPNLLGKTKGSIHNLTFYEWRGQGVVRIKAAKVSNPKSPAQQLNRLNMKTAIDFFCQLRPVLIRSLNFRAENQSAYHKFISLNIHKSFINGSFNYLKFQITTDSFPFTTYTYSFVISEIVSVTVRWINDASAEKLATDYYYFVAYNEVSKRLFYHISDVQRSTCVSIFNLSLGSFGSKTHIWQFFIRADLSISGIPEYMFIINTLKTMYPL